MSTVCIYFQVHQPFRLKEYSFFKIGTDHNYGATQQNYAILQRVSEACYCPANDVLRKQVEKTNGDFRFALSISGTLIDQLQQFRPDVLESFQKLASTGSVEFLNETYYHSLAYLFSPREFERQVIKHRDSIKSVFDKDTTTFRNTELIYSNDLAQTVEKMGYKTVMAEGVERVKGGITHKGARLTKSKKSAALLRNYRLSDDIAFRFTDVNWDAYPLTAEKYATWLAKYADEGQEVINIFLDYETFGEHRKKESGIFEFLEQLPREILKKGLKFGTPSEIGNSLLISKATDQTVYNVPEPISWADAERDLSAWTSDAMQKDALTRVYALEKLVQKAGDPVITEVWSRLQTSDHFYYMSTRYWQDEVHRSFNPYKSPYDAYINYMNIISDFTTLLR